MQLKIIRLFRFIMFIRSYYSLIYSIIMFGNFVSPSTTPLNRVNIQLSAHPPKSRTLSNAERTLAFSPRKKITKTSFRIIIKKDDHGQGSRKIRGHSIQFLRRKMVRDGSLTQSQEMKKMQNKDYGDWVRQKQICQTQYKLNQNQLAFKSKLCKRNQYQKERSLSKNDQFSKLKANDLFDSASTKETQNPQGAPIKKNDFCFVKKLGKGNFGEVFLVLHRKTGFICAMKVILKAKVIKQNYTHQIAQSIIIQSHLDHPNIVPLYSFFHDSLNVYILMELSIDGNLLGHIINNHRLQEQETSELVYEICKGIQYIQKQRIIHRNIKPENIMLSFGIPKIYDFKWVACQKTNKKLLETISGTPLYYLPKIVKNEDYDEKIDVWGVGILCYSCLIGHVPFKFYTMMNLNKIIKGQLAFPEYVELSEASKNFIIDCLKKASTQRLTVEQLLRHPFLKQIFENEDDLFMC